MNIVISGIIIFVITFLVLSWFAKGNSKKIAKRVRSLIIVVSLVIAILLAVGGRMLFSLPLFFLAISALKIKGLTTFQIWQMWRVLNFLRSTGRFSYFGQERREEATSNITLDESYKILGIKRDCSKAEVLKAANGLQKKIHPDLNRDVNSERLSQIVNEAKDKIIKNL